MIRFVRGDDVRMLQSSCRFGLAQEPQPGGELIVRRHVRVDSVARGAYADRPSGRMEVGSVETNHACGSGVSRVRNKLRTVGLFA